MGISLRALARQLEIRSPAIGYCVERGEAIAHENGYRLIEQFFTFLSPSILQEHKNDPMVPRRGRCIFDRVDHWKSLEKEEILLDVEPRRKGGLPHWPIRFPYLPISLNAH